MAFSRGRRCPAPQIARHPVSGSRMRHLGLNLSRFALPAAGCVLLCLLATGCRPNKRYDLIEAELRTRERELADTHAQLEQAKNLNRAYVQQHQPPSTPVSAHAPVYIPVKEIA